MSAERRAQALLFVVPALWSSNYLIARLAQGVVAPHALAFGRWALALALLAPFVARELHARRDRWPAEWRQLLVLGATGMWICGAFVYQAGLTTSATNIALVYAATPVAITVVGARLLRERLGTVQWVAVGMALAGVLLVIVRGDPSRLLAVRFTPGDGWIVVAAISWTAYSLLLRHWGSCLSPLARLAAIIAAGLLVLAPFTVAEALWTDVPQWSWRATGLVAAAALLPGVMSYGAYSFMQRELGASRTALLLYLAPVYAGLGAWALLGERPGWAHVAGAALILPSIALASRRAPGAGESAAPTDPAGGRRTRAR